MKNIREFEQLELLPVVLKWLLLSAVVGVLGGSASAAFIISLEWATQWREAHLWVIALLPVAGFAMGWIYHHRGKGTEAGNNLLIDEIHDPKKVIPLRMAPLILLTTVMTHFFGGSGGREGTAIQMGGSLADQLSLPFHLNTNERRILLMAGISAGFASVFGTPLAGAIFGLEVLTIGRLQYDAILPCFIAAIIGDFVTRLWGIQHMVYSIPQFPTISTPVIALCFLIGIIFGITGMFFAKASHALGNIFKEKIAYPPLRPFVGGLLIVILTLIVGTTRYSGLGLDTIKDSFTSQVYPWDFFGKFVFTVMTLASGFKGGEVTPLFYIGATLGHTLSGFIPAIYLSTPTLAGLGLVAVFAGAANTPIACTLMAIELFGAPIGITAGITCVASYLFSGHAGIYRAQRVVQHKHRVTPNKS